MEKILLIAMFLFFLFANIATVFAVDCTGTQCKVLNAGTETCADLIQCTDSSGNPITDCSTCPGSNFEAVLSVTTSPASAEKTNFVIETAVQGKDSTPILYICWKWGVCFPSAANDIAVVEVSGKNIKVDENPQITTTLYNTNAGPVDVPYNVELLKCNDTICNDTSPVPLSDSTFTKTGVATNIPVEDLISLTSTDPNAFVLPPTVSAQVYIVTVTVPHGGVGGIPVEKDSVSTNNVGTSRFTVSKKYEGLSIPETSPLLAIAVAGIVCMIVFRKK